MFKILKMKKNFEFIVAIKIFFFAVLLSAGSVNAQNAYDITHEESLEAMMAAKKHAEQLDVLVNIAVVDAGANLKAFVRMDGSFLGSIDVAIKKAKTSRYFDIDSGE